MHRHKVFVSYHHANDQAYKDAFVQRFCEVADQFVDHSVADGDIPANVPTDEIRRRIRDHHIRDATVTIVLIGSQTWQRKHVDWEIAASLRQTDFNPRNGLLGILLPTYTVPREAPTAERRATEPAGAQYWPYNIPPRLWENVPNAFAKVRPWPRTQEELNGWIHEAFERRLGAAPSNATEPYANNRSPHQTRWN